MWLIGEYEALDEYVVRNPLESFWETGDLAFVGELCYMFITMASHIDAEDLVPHSSE
jgi:hypothetical protein